MADIASLKQALAVSPDNLPLLLLLGKAYLEEFQFQDARETFEKVIELEPGNPEARTQVAQILEVEGRSSEAIIRLEQVNAEHPGYAPAWMLRAKFALSENDGESARECYDRAVGIDTEVADAELLKRIREAGGNKPFPREGEPDPDGFQRLAGRCFLRCGSERGLRGVIRRRRNRDRI
jgi:cytochrome c-type biogenesis protein CcmH/NrfG